MKIKRMTTELKRYPTTYKQEYLEPTSHEVYQEFAGKPLKFTPIGNL